MKKNKTRTQSFGSSGRQGHDSSLFYESKLYKNLNFKEDINSHKEQVNEPPRGKPRGIRLASPETDNMNYNRNC